MSDAALVVAVVEGSTPALRELNALAARERVALELEPDPDGHLRITLNPESASAAATLLITVIGELSDLDPARLRRCARPECSLVFYDVSRSGTQRWHAESPCGVRERQRRHRAAARPPELT